ncbi:CrcB family protein [Rhodobacteraceae bacterium KLH11]|nr:CrcB family protein [Rhodobacteraceae bacterium KLH11]
MAAQAADLITKTSAHDVPTTIDRLATAVEGAGAKVFARVDHAAGAQSVQSELRPTQMLMFGNPKLGTPAMQLSQSAGLDLPLRVVVYQTEYGDVLLSYHDPISLSEAHGLPTDANVLVKMAGALDKLTNKAISN